MALRFKPDRETFSSGARVAQAGFVSSSSRAMNAASNIYAGRMMERATGLSAQKGKWGTEEAVERQKKMTGVGFWAIIGVGIVKDITDLIANFTLILSIVVFLTSIAASFIVIFYFYTQGVKFNTRKVVTLSCSLIISSIPIISFIPTYTLSIFLVRWMENSETVSKALHKATKG